MCCKNKICQFLFLFPFNNQYYDHQFWEGIVCTFDKEKWCLKKIGLSTPKFLMFYHFCDIINLHQISCNEVLQIMEPISTKKIDNPNYCATLVIFQTYGIIVLKNVHLLSWLLRLWMYPKGSKLQNN